ncbi:DUF4419 domain-containing protein [Myxococcus sp. K15C18031901]|uniref:DUF4419 domain-containing protein n=1 Tax=Myxococcus dinghuensis TaxID=2906761 RepID=UPI0020A719AD|nr:DUF4419 domain-containing protein [Myxococcus dinghuensis]MCP3098362.1 DUF4419 domain-containing protein [Myxococcus dinghuensis]
MSTFAVDAVEETQTPLETVPLGDLIGEALWFVPDAGTRVIQLHGVHPLLAAVHQAFADHRPLVLSPDVVWLTLAQGLAHHIRLNAERFRGRLVRHEGRSTLRVEVPTTPGTDEEFKGLFGAFREQLRVAVGPGLPRLLSCDFSTSTDVERMAGDVVLMDAMSPYFDFEVMISCGIPRITLLGTPEDWRAIRRRVDVVAEFDLGWWTSSLVPILDEFIRASEGTPDREFWKELYKPRQAYGWDRMAGWVMRLFPYVAGAGRFDVRNPLLERPHAELMRWSEENADADGFDVPGIPLRDIPAGLSSVPFHISYEDDERRETWSIEAGVLAAAVDAKGALMPRAGVVVRKVAGISVPDFVETLAAEHTVTRATEPTAYHGLAELTALYDRVTTATLFPGTNPWRVRPVSEHMEVDILLPWGTATLVHCIVDLPDGSVLALSNHYGERPYVLIRLRSELFQPFPAKDLEFLSNSSDDNPRTLPMRTLQPASEIPIVGKSLLEVLTRAIEVGGDVGRLTHTECLAEVLQPRRRHGRTT